MKYVKIEGQVAEAERFAAAHGLTIVKVYADRAQTGRNDNREQFQLMLADAAKHAFDALIVWKTDRIGRNKEEIAINKYHLKVDYILFGKLFCGKCGAMMTGVCGTSKQKVKHYYYICSAKKKKLCTKRAVRQDWIEPLVPNHLLKLIRNEELLEFIAENVRRVF